MAIGGADNGWAVAGVAVLEPSALQVKEAEEHNDEHALVIVLGYFRIHAGSNLRGLHTLRGEDAEQSSGLSHEERCG